MGCSIDLGSSQDTHYQMYLYIIQERPNLRSYPLLLVSRLLLMQIVLASPMQQAHASCTTLLKQLQIDFQHAQTQTDICFGTRYTPFHPRRPLLSFLL